MKSQSESISNITPAFIKAQNEFDPIIKSAKGYNYKYAPLDNCYNATRKALFNNGLGIKQPLGYREGSIQILITTLLHTSGEFFESYTDIDIGQFTSILQNDKDLKKTTNLLHAWGSTLTHLRRYAYCAMLGIIGEDEDNDGVIETHVSQPKGTSYTGGDRANLNKRHEDIVVENVKKLSDLIKESGCDPIDFTKFHGISRNEPQTIKNALVNFKELLTQFNNHSIMGE
jgi:hypothetical protein